jgi:hypothetical protein
MGHVIEQTFYQSRPFYFKWYAALFIQSPYKGTGIVIEAFKKFIYLLHFINEQFFPLAGIVLKYLAVQLANETNQTYTGKQQAVQVRGTWHD